jgi:hypothetical protein
MLSDSDPALARARQVANLKATLGPGPQQGRQAPARGGPARPSSSESAAPAVYRYLRTDLDSSEHAPGQRRTRTVTNRDRPARAPGPGCRSPTVDRPGGRQ